MDVDENGSDSSILEVEVSPKTSPPVIDLGVDEKVAEVAKSPKKKNKKPRTSRKSIKNRNKDLMVPNHWTLDMIKFYNDDWGDEDHFVVEKIQQKMDKSPHLWKIHQKDRHPPVKRKIKCNNCCQYGHTAHECPDELKIVKCNMCGKQGHSMQRCPNAICLNCGNSTKCYSDLCSKCRDTTKSYCKRCKLYGHYFLDCTDEWRRYHLTISEGGIRIPSYNIYKQRREQWCCNCGEKGHNEHRCEKRTKIPPHFRSVPYITSYDDIFNVPLVEKKDNNKRPKTMRYFEKNYEEESDSSPGTVNSCLNFITKRLKSSSKEKTSDNVSDNIDRVASMLLKDNTIVINNTVQNGDKSDKAKSVQETVKHDKPETPHNSDNNQVKSTQESDQSTNTKSIREIGKSNGTESSQECEILVIYDQRSDRKTSDQTNSVSSVNQNGLSKISKPEIFKSLSEKKVNRKRKKNKQKNKKKKLRKMVKFAELFK